MQNNLFLRADKGYMLSQNTKQNISKKPQFNSQNTDKWIVLENVPNECGYIIFPIDFCGKEQGVFTKLNLSAKFILATIYTANKISKGNKRLTYNYFIELFGMSKETISAAFKVLLNEKMIEKVGRSEYRVLVKFNHDDYIIIDKYLLKREWKIGGEKKRLSRSRLLVLALLTRGAKNPNTNGVFKSSHARIGTALNMSRSTAGYAVRQLNCVGAIKVKYSQKHFNRGLGKFSVHPKILGVQHKFSFESKVQEVVSVLKTHKNEQFTPIIEQKLTGEQLHEKLMQDSEYRKIIDDMDNANIRVLKELFATNFIGDSPKYKQFKEQLEYTGKQLATYLKNHNIDKSRFPADFFKTRI